MATSSPYTAVHLRVDGSSSLSEAMRIARAAAAHLGGLVLGSAFWAAHGRAGAVSLAVAAPRLPLLLDLRLADDPRDVGAAVEALGAGVPRASVSVSARAGTAALAAAVASSRRVGDRCLVLAHLDGGAPREGLRDAMRAGCHGVVCRGRDLTALRPSLRSRPAIVSDARTGALRDPSGATSTLAEAVLAGAAGVILGRELLGAADPAMAAAAAAAAVRASVMARVREEARRADAFAEAA